MRKIATVIAIITLMCFSSSCIFVGPIAGQFTGGLMDNEAEKADAQLEHVIKAINNKDKDALKAVFSKKTINEAKDLDGNADYIFDLIQGEIISWERKDGGPSMTYSSDYGYEIKEVDSFYYVNTEKQKYFFNLDSFSADTAHPDNVGLYMLIAVKAEDEMSMWSGYPGVAGAGIFIPKE